MTIPHDIARCAGVQYDGDWREGCEDCLRRTSPGGPMSPTIEAPVMIVFWCEYRIGPRDVPERTSSGARRLAASRWSDGLERKRLRKL